MNDKFYEGLEVYYHKQVGVIQFICDSYIVVCIAQGNSRVHNVCLVVYPKNYEYVIIAKQSEK